MASESAYETPVRYVTTFKASKLPLKKLRNNKVPTNVLTAKFPCFDGTGGLEALFYVIEYFTQASKDELDFTIATTDTLDYEQ